MRYLIYCSIISLMDTVQILFLSSQKKKKERPFSYDMHTSSHSQVAYQIFGSIFGRRFCIGIEQFFLCCVKITSH